MDNQETEYVTETVTVDGKEVNAIRLDMTNGETLWIKAKLPAKENQGIVAAFRQWDADSDLLSIVPFAKGIILAWSHDGSPQDDNVYGDLDATDLWVITRTLNTYWLNRMFREPKKEHKPSS